MELDDDGLPAVIVDDGADGRRETTEDDQRRWVVEAVGEIWCVDDEWWRSRINRRYVEVMLEGGKHVMLYEDLETGRWYMQRP